MADYLVTDTELTSVANAIRTKGGTSASLSFPTGFVSAINAIETGGGGFSEFEEGTIILDADTKTFDITFQNTHSTTPWLFCIADTTSTRSAVKNTTYALCFVDYYHLFGSSGIADSGSSSIYANVFIQYLNSSTSPSTAGTGCSTSYKSSSSTARYHTRYWVNETTFKVYSGTSSTLDTNNYWRKSRTFKWIAIWI